MNQQIRKLFYTYRNGVVADALKSVGDPHQLIFGLQLPHLSEIARMLKDQMSEDELKLEAEQLWSERNCRESRLLAPYLMKGDELSKEEAESLLDDCLNHEETDILVFRCLRHCPHSTEICKERSGRYDSTALARFL